MTTEPAIIDPNCKPAIVTTGMRTFLISCLFTISLGVRPLAFAVRTKSVRTTSSMADLVIRIIFAAQEIPTAKHGIIKPLKPDRPCDGNQPSLSEKNIIIINPNQNDGIAIPSIPNTVASPSMKEYCFKAEIVPKGMPTKIAISIPPRANSMVMGNR